MAKFSLAELERQALVISNRNEEIVNSCNHIREYIVTMAPHIGNSDSSLESDWKQLSISFETLGSKMKDIGNKFSSHLSNYVKEVRASEEEEVTSVKKSNQGLDQLNSTLSNL